MIARYREDMTGSILMVGAIILLAGSLAFVLLVEKPKPMSKAVQIEAQNKLKLDTAAAQKKRDAALVYNAANSWTGSPDEIAPAVLARVTNAARARNLRLVSLRPQRIDDKSVPPILPFLAVVDGPYTSAVQFARDLEAPGGKLAVTLIQVTSSDAATDRVTASVGLAAFMQPAKVIPAKDTSKENNSA